MVTCHIFIKSYIMYCVLSPGSDLRHNIPFFKTSRSVEALFATLIWQDCASYCVIHTLLLILPLFRNGLCFGSKLQTFSAIWLYRQLGCQHFSDGSRCRFSGCQVARLHFLQI